MNLGKENETIEFKSSTAELHQGIESISAILNKKGHGELYFGVLDNGEVKGQNVSDSTIKTISDSILRDIEPKIIPSIEILSYGNKDIVKVLFSGNQRPYSAFGRFLIRVGSQNRQMSRNELIKLIKDENYSYQWEKLNSGSKISDIDDETLKKYFDEAVSCGRLDMKVYNKKELLSSLELYDGKNLKNACVALFGKRANIGLKVACYATDEKITFTDLNSIKGNVYSLINTAVTYVLNHINWKAEIGVKRKEVPEIPVKAIREMVVNAFAHATYDPSPEIEINIHPGKITIFNPGTFPSDLTPKDFINRNISSVKRNPLMLDVLYRCKDVEKSGTGFKRMNALCKEAKIKWNSESTPYGFYFTFFRVPNRVPNRVTKKLNDSNLNEEEKAIYIEICNNSKITRDSLSKVIGKSKRTIQRIIDRLVEKKYIVRVGNNRFGYWDILK